MKVSNTLSSSREVVLEQGTIRYIDVGSGPTLLFVHGLLANSTLWRKVVPLLASRFRCIAPDLPLGGHVLAMLPAADLSPAGVAGMVNEFMEALDLRDVTLIGNDTGGAICQLLITRYPERIAGLVLTNTDCFEAFFPRALNWLAVGARRFGNRFVDSLAVLLRPRPMQRLLMALVSRSHFAPAQLDAYLAPFLHQPAIRRDVTRFLQQVSNRATLEAAALFPHVQQPVCLVWGENDFLFPLRLGQRLQRAFPDARLHVVAPSRAFVPEDQPDLLAEQIAAFVQQPAVHVS